MDNRAEHYLRVLFASRGEWIHIHKLKRQVCKKENAAEQQRTFKSLCTLLTLMGIRYLVHEKRSYTICLEKNHE